MPSLFPRSPPGDQYLPAQRGGRTLNRMARNRALLLPLLLVCSLPVTPLHASETVAEHTANIYAAHEVAAAPVHGNLPDYSLPPEKLVKAQHLAHLGMTLHFLDEAWGILLLVLLLWTGAVAYMRDRAVAAGRNPWLQGYVFLFLFALATALLNLPLDIYSHAVSLRYGFSVQRWGSWLGDLAKGFLLEWIFGGLVLMLLFWIIRRQPHRWWLIFWVCAIPITFLFLFASPYVEPLFNHYEPLARTQPALVQRLEEVAQRGHMNIPPDRMFLMQASAKLTTLNADVEGFGHSKRVVVWDNTIAKMTPDQILFVFGHESGHYVLNHINRGIAWTLLALLLLLYLGYHLVNWAIARFGAQWRIPSQGDWGALAVLLLAFALFSIITGPVAAVFSRSSEYAADVYGQEAVHGIVADPQRAAQGAFQVLGELSLSDPNPAPWYEFLTFDHPANGRRAAFAHAYHPWAPGLKPKYFPR